MLTSTSTSTITIMIAIGYKSRFNVSRTVRRPCSDDMGTLDPFSDDMYIYIYIHMCIHIYIYTYI